MHLVGEIWASFRRLPVWVQAWVALILVPVNLLPLGFFGAPWAPAVAALSVGGMLPNLPIMVIERGMSKRMAIPHVLIWTPLVLSVAWLLWAGPDLTPAYRTMLLLLLVVDLISLGFDVPDAVKWYRGDRGVA